MKKIEIREKGKYDRTILVRTDYPLTKCLICKSKDVNGLFADSSDSEYSAIQICENCLKELLNEEKKKE